MKRFFIITILCLSCAMGFAQWEDNAEWGDATPETIEIDNTYLKPWSTEGHKYQWYLDQACAWQRVVEKEPKNENAWRNFFYASYYCETKFWNHEFKGKRENSRTAIVMRKMKEAIPGTHTFNLCASQYWLAEWGKLDKNVVIDALDNGLMNLDVEEIRFLTYKLWTIDYGNNLVFTALRRLYDLKYYPERIMAYGWNLMLGMQDSAVYVARNSYDYEQMILIQEVFDTRKDITIIPCSAIKSKAFRNYISKRLDIKPFVRDTSEALTDKQLNAAFIKYLYGQWNRPIYLPMSITYHADLDRDSIYNEGLLLRYSAKRYDNISVARHNFKDVYELDYLAQPVFVHDTWQYTRHVDNDVVRCMVNMAGLFYQMRYDEDGARLEKQISKIYNRDHFEGLDSRYTRRSITKEKW